MKTLFTLLILTLSVGSWARFSDGRSCSNQQYYDFAKKMMDSKDVKKILKNQKYKINGYSVDECPAFWAAIATGRPHAAVARSPECGLKFRFETRAGLINFADEIGSSISAVDGRVYVCGEVIGKIVPQ
jgi:hypothetical protein